jgi:hypothetical protein
VAAFAKFYRKWGGTALPWEDWEDEDDLYPWEKRMMGEEFLDALFEDDDEDDDDEGFIPKIKAPTAPPSLPAMPGANKGLPMPPAPMSKPNLPPPPTMPPVAAPKKAAAMWGAGDDDDDEDVGFAPKPKT